MSTLFVIEDNDAVRESVVEYCRVGGYTVKEFDRAAGVEEALRAGEPDAVVLDVMLPDGNGFLLAKEIRRSSDVPIIFLTVRGEESDRVMGFECGADDYVVKPFSAKELLLRIRAILRRAHDGEEEPVDSMTWQRDGRALTIDLRSRQALLNEQVLSLTNAEWEILTYLASHPGWAISRERILGECLGYLYPGPERTVDTHVSNIRTKLVDGSWIETVRGYGYRFVPEG